MSPGISTEELNHQIEEATNIEDFLNSNRKYMLSGSLSDHLTVLLTEKNVSKADVVRGSLLDRAYALMAPSTFVFVELGTICVTTF